MDIKYNMTYHAVERLQQRFGAFCTEIPLLKNWKREQGLGQLKPLFNDMLDFAEENKSYQNNSAYMIDLYEKYGYDTEYCFLELKEKNILFILAKARSAKEYMLVTLMPMDYRPSVKNIKYAGKEEKKLNFDKFLMNWSKHDIIDNKRKVPQPIKYEIEQKTFKVKSPEKPQLNEAVQVEKISIIKTPEKPQLDEATKLLHKKLIDSVRLSEAVQVERISNTKCIYTLTLDSIEYEFTYIKANSGKSIEINHQHTLSPEEQINFDNGFRQLYPNTYLYQNILKLIKNDEAKLTSEVNNNQKVYKVNMYNQAYNVTLIENETDEPTLIARLKQNINVKGNPNPDELKSTGVKLEEDNLLYQKIIEATNNQDFYLVEKYSATTSLRTTTIDNIEYQYVYIKRNNKEKDREIILQNQKEVENNTVYKNTTQCSEIENTKPVKIKM